MYIIYIYIASPVPPCPQPAITPCIQPASLLTLGGPSLSQLAGYGSTETMQALQVLRGDATLNPNNPNPNPSPTLTLT